MASAPAQPDGPARPIITLTTDFDLDDWYVATMKAVLLRHAPHARLIDVTHRVPAGDVLCGSISLERAIDGFPKGSIHLAVVDPGVGSHRRLLISHIKDQWVVCPDNGLITWAWHRHPGAQAYELTWRPTHSSPTFHGRDIMGPIAGMLAAGTTTLEQVARPLPDPILLDVTPAKPPITTGRVIHIDHFGNATTNVPDDVLKTVPGAEIRVASHNLGRLKRTYTDATPGEPLALIGSSGLLEIAVRDGSAADDLGLRVGAEIRIEAPARTTEQLRALDKQHVWHPFTPMSLWLDSDPLVITAAEGMHLIDSDGNRYLDGVSSLWCNVHGHRVPEIDNAIRDQLDKVAHTTMLGLSNEPAILLADRLMKIVPQNLKKIFYSDSGATATEIAFKLAVQYWHNLGHHEKHEFIGFTDAYHGDTTGAMSVGRTPAFHRPYFPLLFKVHYAPTRHASGNKDWEKRGAVIHLEHILREHAPKIAAIAIEPIVQGAAGMLLHPPGFLHQVWRLAKQYNVLLIADEVATGFGRTGKMFACEHESVQPDLMCVAKGITGGYLPLAATFATQKIFDAFLGKPSEGRTFFHGHTYTGNPLACAAALASLDLFEKNKLLQRVEEKSRELATMLAPLRDLPHVGDVRQKGFMVGIELVADKATRKPFDPARRLGAEICQRLRSHGVLLRPLADTIVLMPPLAMEIEDLRTIITALSIELRSL
jgi:adenosylmethionine-8-amino-7-oxononanoate aminotransferase